MKNYRLFTILGTVVIVLFLIDVFVGSVRIPPGEVLKAIFGGGAEKESWNYIIRELRLPRVSAAVLAGAGLSTAGLLMQTFFRNPLAGPYVLGISSGAGLGVAIYVMFGTYAFGSLFGVTSMTGSAGLLLAAVIGATGVLLVILLISLRVSDHVSLLIVGLMLGNATGAIVSVLQYFSSPELVQYYLIWTFGSLGGVNWEQMQVMLPVVLLGMTAAFLCQKSLNALLIGETQARGLGISIGRTRTTIIIATGLMAGAITAFCGPIAFIGIAVPHITRSILKTFDHGILIPGVAMVGAAVTISCDILSQLPGKSATLPLNAITALFGAPIVIWVILRNRKLRAVVG